MLLPALAVISAAGCSAFNSLNPFASSGPKMAELQPITPTIEARVAWKESVSKSEQYVFTPAIVGSVVYAAGAKGDVVRLEDGAVKWKVNVGVPLSGGVGTDGSRVVVGSPKGDIIALDSSDGKELWRSKVTSDVLAAPAVDRSIVVVRSGDNRLYGFDPLDGKRKWVYQRQTPPLSLRTFAAPLINSNYVFAGFPGGKLVAVTLNNGAVAWEGAVALPKGTTELDRVADITSAPVLAGRLICAVAYQGRVACFDLSTGNLAWARDMSSSAGLAVDGRYAYVSDDKGALHALDLASGASIWKQDKLFLRQLSAPAARGRLVAVADVKGVVHFISRDDGSFVARLSTDGTPVTAPLQILDDKVLLQTKGGAVMALEAQ
ncbi:MAG: outer membrane protein assembly factor BamB [Betaproteobacteria bacterium]|uniref:Outer membrane protein assembly factor BamB n=1 Tax=Candidatus Proximibacter danicus TaxID=2954365 RepID=A0A9D7PSD2_9PROT|nr:outer membrane protein assembly factor BamB [Candidatus Proximibacter danicus]MBK9446705.1 outer membrane protein assembly factor BamB [Betaproteobacteria bacterium]